MFIKPLLELTLAKAILMYGLDSQLLESRRQVLESSGYYVSPLNDHLQIHEALGSENFDLLVLCHTLTNDDCDRMLAVASTRWPHIKTLTLTAGKSGCRTNLLTEVFDIFDGPSRLISKVNRML